MGGTIAADRPILPSAGAALSLIFTQGQRPDKAALSVLAARAGAGFAISHYGDRQDGWLELLVSGMVIDCHGLPPAPTVPVPADGALLGLGAVPQGTAISLQPGPHLAEAAALLPVVRAVVSLGLELATLPGLLALCWNPARCWMAPDYFGKVAGDWLEGGPFPALGLTSLQRGADGAITSRGLAHFTGQELYVPAGSALTPADQARIAVRLINELVEREALTEPVELTGPGGETVLLEPVPDEARLRVTVRRD